MHCYLVQGDSKEKSIRTYLQKNGYYINERMEFVTEILLNGKLYITLVDVQDNDDQEYQVFVEAYEGEMDHTGGYKMHLVEEFGRLPNPLRKRVNALCSKIFSLSILAESTEQKSVQIPLFLVN